MRNEPMKINQIPAILWGEKSDRAYIFVHGRLSCKEDARDFAEIATESGYQVLSFDLPEHGDRKDSGYPCDVQNGVHDLGIIGEYARQNWRNIGLFASSLGAYFSLLAYKNVPLESCLFLSPVLDMERLIQNMMKWSGVSEELLKEKRKVQTPTGELDWEYYRYVKEHPVNQWDAPTAILYGSEDDVTERDVVNDFVNRFHGDLTVLQGSEHYFHTEEQLGVFRQWLRKHIPYHTRRDG